MTENSAYLDKDLVQILRQSARNRMLVADLIRTVQTHVNGANALTVMTYFMEAFGLSLSAIRELEGAEALGNAALSDNELEMEFQPVIQKGIADIDAAAR